MMTIKKRTPTASSRRRVIEETDVAVRRSVRAALHVHSTLLWWALLSSISLFNIAVWFCTYRALSSGDEDHLPARHPHQRRHLLLSGVYVFVCAYRSFWPRIDLERYCLWDTFASSIFLGRLAATIAEMSFACQVALFLHGLGEALGHSPAMYVALGLVPAIAIAQAFCWCGVVTLNHLFHAIEESIWAASAALVGIVLGSMAVYHPGNRSLYYLGAWGAVASFAFCGFMVSVDVPMYVRRWKEGRIGGGAEAGRKGDKKLAYMTSFEGGRDALHRRVVTKSWDVWREETVWLTGYFSSAVWLSLLMVHFPAPV